MRDHDEVFRRVIKAKEQYEQQKKEKSMFRFMKNAPRGGASYEIEEREESSGLFVWAVRAASVLVWVLILGGITALVYFGAKGKDTKGRSVGESGQTPTNQPTNTLTGRPTNTPTARPASLLVNGSGTLTLWCTANEDAYDRNAYEQAVAEMQARYPNIQLHWQTFSDPYSLIDALETANQQGEAPDIFYEGFKYALDNMAERGQAYCLDGVFANCPDGLSEAVRKTVTYDGHMYGVPYTFNAVVLYVNREVLRSAGINTVPSTYDELIACCETLRNRGKVPFGCATEGWCISEYLEQMIIKNAGASALEATWRDDVSWQNPKVAEAIDLFEEYVRKGYFSSADTESERENSAVLPDFMNGRYAFYVSGSWYGEDFANCGKDIVAVEFPVINNANAAAGQFLCNWGGALAVHNGSDQKELAAQYAMELGQLLSKYMYLGGHGLPAWQVNYETSGVNPFYAQIEGIVRYANAFAFTSDSVMDSRILEQYVLLVRRIYNGEISGADYTAAMEALR